MAEGAASSGTLLKCHCWPFTWRNARTQQQTDEKNQVRILLSDCHSCNNHLCANALAQSLPFRVLSHYPPHALPGRWAGGHCELQRQSYVHLLPVTAGAVSPVSGAASPSPSPGEAELPPTPFLISDAPHRNLPCSCRGEGCFEAAVPPWSCVLGAQNGKTSCS